ncbi:MAG: hypothetical protein E7570_08790 [Ruminococcaceae bacterium]|nr:hypothetical protein [Oscillospiraceae bacterium]
MKVLSRIVRAVAIIAGFLLLFLGSFYNSLPLLFSGFAIFFIVFAVSFPRLVIEHRKVKKEEKLKIVKPNSSKTKVELEEHEHIEDVYTPEKVVVGDDDFQLDYIIDVEGQNLIINPELYNPFFEKKRTEFNTFYVVVKLNEKCPTVNISEEGEITASYKLDNYENEDFTDCIFYIKCAVTNDFGVVSMMLEGAVVDSIDDAHPVVFSYFDSIIYRFQIHYANQKNNEKAKQLADAIDGVELKDKALQYENHITPSNVRCVGICSNCKKSFVFLTKNYPMLNAIPVYSDDGIKTAELHDTIVNKNNWSITLGGITYRYYNSFCCKECGHPYIDYRKNHEMKAFGNLGCVHLKEKEIKVNSLSELANEESDILNFDLF